MIGQTVSHYRIVELIGAGGMGVVYKAEDTQLRRLVALKVLPVDLTQDPEAKARLLLEAQAASALDHPNICTIHSVEETADGRVFVAMSLYEGETLKQRIAQGPLPIADVVRFGIRIARAVSAAHEAGVIHRDIKPANIMLTSRGGLKLLDFGVAKQSGRTELTRTGITFGTIPYMAPEQVEGQGADQQTDVWALGVVLYEMLSGQRPFQGEHEVATINAIAHHLPAPLTSRRPDIPPELERVVTRALQKSRDVRYPSAGDMLRDLESMQATSALATAAGASGEPASPRTRRPLQLMAAGMALGVGLLGSWWFYQANRTRTTRDAVKQFEALIQEERSSAAFRLMMSVESRMAGDADYETARNAVTLPGHVTTTPADAAIYVKGYDEPDAEWLYLGQSPLDVRGPLGNFRWRIVKQGYSTFEGGGRSVGLADFDFPLRSEGTVPEGMVPVPGGTVEIGGAGSVPIEGFYIDRYEVTNRMFKKFVDAGGYLNRAYWQTPFAEEGRTLSWDDGMARLRDATGRPGPAGWELSTYPSGEDDVPVGGVSWYEANAYAAWAQRELPTVHHWRLAAPNGYFSEIVEASNFTNRQAAPVGTYRGLGEHGTYDMAGNLREWCVNSIGDRHYILGGAWNQPNYMYQSLDALGAFDRSATNGFRTILRESNEPNPDALLTPIETLTRDYRHAVPVTDQEFDTYRRLYAYDPSDLEAVVESTDDGSDAWRVERVSFTAAYGGERITAYLFLPKTATAPYQTVVYFPHSGGEALKSFEQSEMNYLGFIVRGGRALLLPMYKGTYERRLARPPDGPNARRDLTVQRIKDLQRSVDYVLSRPDLDPDRLAYFGVSLGARLGNISLAIEQRFKAAVLWSGGFRTSISPVPPEVDEVNFAPRVATPTLMLNGREDFSFPVDASQVPMFEALGTPSGSKRHVLYPGGHVFPFARVVKDTLEWLDTWFGLPR